MIPYKKCPFIQNGEVCFGDERAKCFKSHHSPIKYCPNIALGNPCGGMCGLKHAKIHDGNFKCRKGLRNGKPCKLSDCPFPHPNEFMQFY